MAAVKLFIGNLSYTADREQLKELFAQYGTVESVNVIEGRGFGFVEMASREEAELAKKELNGQQFLGRTLNVDEARSDRDRGGPRTGGGGAGRY
jgi:RNA recognition motif-containing protein